MIPRRLGWVWQDAPPPAWPAGLDGVLVRAANGAGTTGAGGFDYRANYRAWRRAFGVRVLPWTWVGPPTSSDGRACAEALVTAAADGGPIGLYVVDIEDALPHGQMTAFRRRLRELDPGALLGFSSYPTAAQATAHGVPWAECVGVCDLGMPQVYWPYQRALLSQILADHGGKPVHVAVSPGDDPQWIDSARWGLDHAGVSIWRYGLPGFGSWAAGLGRLDGGSGIMLDAQTADQIAGIVRGVLNEGTPQGGTNWAAGNRNLVGLVQSLVNRSNGIAGGIADVKSAVLGAIAALDTAHLTEADKHALAAELASLVPDPTTPDEVLDALRARLAA